MDPEKISRFRSQFVTFLVGNNGIMRQISQIKIKLELGNFYFCIICLNEIIRPQFTEFLIAYQLTCLNLK